MGQHFGGVNSPRPLVEAHSDGSLVLFVGAGASIDPPSAIPGFRELAIEVAEKLHQPWDDDIADHVETLLGRLECQPNGFEQETAAVRQLLRSHHAAARPEDFLGRLDDQPDADVHKRVADRIRQSPGPNQLHKRIAALAGSACELRIVTTNYDIHLTTVLESMGTEFEEFRGPALPLGNKFKGLVYLHGNINQSPEELVVTDSDFAAAYLQDGWAARFLERMFSEYTVLFVGYSHSDTMMHHIGRALRSDNDRRFALVAKDSLDRRYWKRFGIHPITYEVTNGSRGRLGEAIRVWADQAAMGLTDHRQKIRDMVSGPPPQKPEDVSYMEETIRDPERVQFFVEFARDLEWLRWISERPAFLQIFNTNLPSLEGLPDGLGVAKADSATIEQKLAGSLRATEALAGWFAEHYALNPEHYAQTRGGFQDALTLTDANGGRLSRPLWNSIRRCLPNDLSVEWARSWVLRLIANGSETDWESLSYLLRRLRWPRDSVLAMLLFDSLTEPRCRPGREYWLSKAWEDLFKPNLTEAAPAVLSIMDRHLRRAHQIQITSDRVDSGWDPISSRRSAIEPQHQDKHRNHFDVLIDAARDCLEALLKSGGRLGCFYLDGWANSNIIIFRRLAVHGWAERTDVDGTEKIEWLLSLSWIHDRDLWHEMFRLIEKAIPTTSRDVADRLVEQVRDGPPEGADAEVIAPYQFELLGWIARHAPQLKSAKNEFERIKEDHPRWETEKHPDFLSWFEIETFTSPPFPIPLDELHRLLSVDADSAMERLLIYKDQTSTWDGPTWSDALSQLTETVCRYPADGFLVLDTPTGTRHDIAKRVVEGWSRSTLDSETVDRVANRLLHLDLHAVKEEVAGLLSEGGPAWRKSPSARKLASMLWETLEDGDAS